MKVLFCGDVVGRSGRTVVTGNLPELRRRLGIDFAVVNGENAAHGFGITPAICDELGKAGADAVTTGNHVWDQRELIGAIDAEPRLIRPLNFAHGTPGRGAFLYQTTAGRRVLVAQVMGRLFMPSNDCPFAALDRLLSDYTLGRSVDAVIVDVHAEATSEKMALGHHLDGRVSLVAGTHTHVPSADAQILPKGTAYISDLGMCGDYDSVIGMEKGAAIFRFVRSIPGERLSPASGPATLCGAMIEINNATGLAIRIEPVRLGGRLRPAMPE